VTALYVNALAIDPTTPSTLYAAGGINGVFQSTNSGGSWSNTGLSALVLGLAIDPTTPSTLYVGTLGPGVFQSTNSGGSWTRVNSGLGDAVLVTALAIDPHTPTTLYAPTDAGVFQSTNSGGSWSPVNTGLSGTALYVNALAIDPTRSSTLYAATSAGLFSIQQVATCTGDCDGSGAVGVNEIITLVNIALGTAEPSDCPNGGLPIGGDVNIAVLIQAVNHALSACGSG
jgi:hypothetical protein